MRVGLYRHALAQGAGLAALARLVLSAARRAERGPVEAPGPWLRATLPAPGRALVGDYLRESGGDARDWGDELPPHLFAQFAMPLAVRVIAGLPYPVHRTLNAGCSWAKRAPLPCGEPLEVSARLESQDADEARVRATVRILAGTAAAPEALDAAMRVFIPLARGRREGDRPGAARREVLAVPEDAQPIDRLSIGSDAGAAFAALTGDFNPIHWLWPAARLAGFATCILQGFAMHARVVEAVGAALPAGVRSLRGVDVRFARPLLLPADVGVYVRGRELWLGNAPGAPANLIGSYVLEDGR